MFRRTIVIRILSAAIALSALVGTRPAVADHAATVFGSGLGGPVVTVPGSTLQKGRWTVGFRTEIIEIGAFSDQKLEDFALEGEEVHSIDQVFSPSLSIGYGISELLTLGIRLPYVVRKNLREGHDEGGGVVEIHEDGDAEGLGDLTVLGQVGLKVLGVGQLAGLIGVKLPTGANDVENNAGEPFEVEHQPGSGSVDPLLGLAWTHAFERVSIDANTLVAVATDGHEDVNLGSLVNLNAAVSWRAAGPRLAVTDVEHSLDISSSRPALDLALEVNGEWRDRETHDGEKEENSGGTLVYLAPGARVWFLTHWSALASIGVPVVQELEGIQHETDLRFLFGLAAGF